MSKISQGLRSGALLQNGKYHIERVLGQGGFGITYLAVHIRLKKQVAIKEFFPKALCDRDADTSCVRCATDVNSQLVEKLRNKFLKEAEHIAEMDSPYIVKITDMFEENGTAYYIMDYVEGSSLSEMVKSRGPLPEGQAIDYVCKIGEALSYIHSKHMNHLDVKPANIMVRKKDNTPILIDFGLSKQYDSEGNQTSTTPPGISHGYAPMEQYNDGGVRTFSPQTDLYSLAATLYYLLSGVTPPSAMDLMEEELTFPPLIPPRLINPISRAMSPLRKARHESVAQFAGELKAPQANDDNTGIVIKPTPPEPTPKPRPRPTPTPQSAPKPQPAPAPAPKPAKSGKLPYIIAACVAAVAVIAGIIWFTSGNKTDAATGSDNGHEYVDLGLSVKWAACNVGASSPADSGDYFAWGETRTKSSYDEYNSLTYNKSVHELRSADIVDSWGELTPAHDAAAANWGGSWRMPTEEEVDELITNCSWELTMRGGRDCWKVTGPNGSSIFLPVAGFMGDSDFYCVGEFLGYWSAAVGDDTENSYLLYSDTDANPDSLYIMGSMEARYFGFPVRPVKK